MAAERVLYLHRSAGWNGLTQGYDFNRSPSAGLAESLGRHQYTQYE
jgi:hypothetical protein